MLFRRAALDRIAAGEDDLAFRRWRRPAVKPGGTLQTAVGVLRVTAVETIADDAVTDDDARRAGFADRAELLAAFPASEDRELYRVELHREGDDPRIALREDADLTSGELAAVTARLTSLESRRGPWTREVLRLIAGNPGTRAADLAARLGRETPRFKADVRSLKELGLTESLEVGYRISPRGRAILDTSG
ncbi:hypothetical protein [Phytomonospora endophytica]|uniref:ASCH domain-containing protein n=1 Tax=Phytomonospora endophytica TaxID=714109 RepID=A0A841F6K4_9ACTN|nr:hypothetical protein [Phytomonospora endophytica]MBB6032571.1 hypothetical protein [Phytomonospora endophytica]GIG66279.1 hypothetical protein Pen01_25740 [Phytomonospora endophytica]